MQHRDALPRRINSAVNLEKLSLPNKMGNKASQTGKFSLSFAACTEHLNIQAVLNINDSLIRFGEMAERLNALVLKTSKGL